MGISASICYGLSMPSTSYIHTPNPTYTGDRTLSWRCEKIKNKGKGQLTTTKVSKTA